MIHSMENKVASRHALQLLTIAIVLLIMVGCLPWASEEVERVTSPDSIVDAVVIQSDAGATTPFVHEVYIVPKGGKPSGTALLTGDHLIGFELKWLAPRFLEIRYKQGRIYKFTNFWRSKEIQNFSYIVELRLVPLSDSFSLSKEDRGDYVQ